MSHRIAPDEGMQTHFDAILYLNRLSINWKLRKAGKPHELTLIFIGQWQRYRENIAECNRMIPTWSYLGDRPFKMNMKHATHAFTIQFIDTLIANLEAEYDWPAPLEPLVNELDIATLRRHIRELEGCRTLLVKY